MEKLRHKTSVHMLFGLMFPCSNGIVPYSGQKCFEDSREFPDISWVKQQILGNKIDFLGELMNEYYCISASDPRMFPYYELTLKYNLPVGIHTGGVGPGNLSPNNDKKMGNSILMKDILIKYPGLKIWIMHAGFPHLEETVFILKYYP